MLKKRITSCLPKSPQGTQCQEVLNLKGGEIFIVLYFVKPSGCKNFVSLNLTKFVKTIKSSGTC
jgi:hypothetical protein